MDPARARDRVRILGAALVIALHLAVAAWHNAAHARVPVPMAAWEEWYVAIVVILAPFAALALFWRRRWRTGSLVLGASMVGALAFDLAQHYLLGGAAGVGRVGDGPWSGAYRTSALFLVATESLALWLASWVLRRPELGGPLTRRTRRRRRHRRGEL